MILLIEDDENLGASLKEYLITQGFSLDWAKSIKEAQAKTSQTTFELLLLDWMLPDGQGIDFLRELKKTQPVLPVIFLTARTDLIDKVVGLETGANDYLTKPFEPRELVARIRVQLRTQPAPPSQSSVIKAGTLEIDLDARSVRYGKKAIDLTKMEFELLKLLATNAGKVFTREELLNQVWGFENFPTTRTVDTHILQLRQKLSEDIFETVRGVGYKFKS